MLLGLNKWQHRTLILEKKKQKATQEISSIWIMLISCMGKLFPELRRQKIEFLSTKIIGFQGKMECCMMVYRIFTGIHHNYFIWNKAVFLKCRPRLHEITYFWAENLPMVQSLCTTEGCSSSGAEEVKNPHWAPHTFRLNRQTKACLIARRTVWTNGYSQDWASNHCTLSLTKN